jgi:hypothetical protein
LNSYLVDFFKHGDKTALERENGIRAADMWFRLKDFSLVLASIVASLEEFLRPGSGDMDQDGTEGDYGYDEENGAAVEDWDGEEHMEAMADDGRGGEECKGGEGKQKKKKKTGVVDSWEDEETSEPDSEVKAGRRWGIGHEESSEDEYKEKDTVGSGQGQDQSLVKVYKALRRVKTEFDEKFHKIWA